MDSSHHSTISQQRLDSIEEAANFIRSRTYHQPQVGIVCGSGLAGLADVIDDATFINYAEIPHFVQPSVQGHVGRLVIGYLGDKCVMCMQGRVHPYEGYSMWQITLPIRVMGALGVQYLLVSNTCGGLNPDYKVGTFVLIKDHINLFGLAGKNPLDGLSDPRFGERFVSMTNAYDRQLRRRCLKALRASGLAGQVEEGVLVSQTGPSFETPAECRMMKMWGADLVGMSVVHEVTVARQLNMICLGVSLVVNMSILDYDEEIAKPSHDETLDSSGNSLQLFQQIIRLAVQQLGAENGNHVDK